MRPSRSERRPALGRPLATLLAGSAGGQAVALALAPALTRLYPPDAFARLGLLVATASLLAPLATLGLEAAIVLERDERSAREMLGLCLVLASLAAVPCLVLGSAPLAVAVFSLAAGSVLTARALAIGRTRAVAAARLVRSAGTGAAQLAFAVLVGGTGGSLVLGLLAGQLGALLVSGLLLGGTSAPLLPCRTLPGLAGRHRRLLLWSSPQTLLNNAGNTAVPLLLSRFAAAALGGWTLANRVVMLPAATLGEAMRQSLLPAMGALATDDAALLAVVRRSTVLAAVPLGLAAAAAFAVGPRLFAAVFGPPWREAGRDAALLLSAEAAGIANIPAVVAITVRGWQRGFFLYGALTVPLRVAAVAAFAAASGATAALAAHATLAIASSLLVSLGVRRALRASRAPTAALRPRVA